MFKDLLTVQGFSASSFKTPVNELREMPTESHHLTLSENCVVTANLLLSDLASSAFLQTQSKVFIKRGRFAVISNSSISFQLRTNAIAQALFFPHLHGKDTLTLLNPGVTLLLLFLPSAREFPKPRAPQPGVRSPGRRSSHRRKV